jgi:hypothetical protein
MVGHNPEDDKIWTFCDLCGVAIQPGWPPYGTFATCENHEQCLECGHWIDTREEQLNDDGICILCDPTPYSELEQQVNKKRH